MPLNVEKYFSTVGLVFISVAVIHLIIILIG